MSSLQKYCVTLFAVLALVAAAPAFAAEKEVKKPAAAKEAPKAADAKKDPNEIIATGWSFRCANAPEKNEKGEAKIDKKTCEAFQRLDMKASKMRLSEFAVGFPEEKGLDKGDARGVAVLPLGVALEQGVAMKIDDKKPVSFKVRYCTTDGCFGFMTLDKELLEDMSKGKLLTFVFKSFTGQDVNLIMSLEGFGAVVKEIQP